MIIPLSLYVTIEITKLVQVYLIHNDRQLYDSLHDKSTECRALNVPEELGQVQYMFCDKTGTLTENKMVFKRCALLGKDFNHNSYSVGNSARAVIPPNPELAEHLNNLDIQVLVEGTESNLSPMCATMREFFILLAVCNTVVVSKTPKRDTMDARGVIVHDKTAGRRKAGARLSNLFTDFPSQTPTRSTPLSPDQAATLSSVLLLLLLLLQPPGRPRPLPPGQ